MTDYTKIEKLPDVPKDIIDAVENKKLVVFIGAGVSRIIGCMGWAQLAANLINICFTTQNKEKSRTCINFKEKESLENENNHKKIITICHYILCKKNDLKEKFFEAFDKALESDGNKENEYNIYKEIFGLRGINITTNADKHFHKLFNEANRIFEEKDLIASFIDRGNLYKIHGSQDQRESLVFTISQYIQRYNNKNFRGFLHKIFSDYTILFLGYGMSEFELLDFLITKYDSPNKSKHYTLLPFYSGEENLLDFEQSYYNPMGIQVIGYEKDEKGYNQLYNVLQKWNKEITLSYTYVSYKEIDDLVNNLEIENIPKILQLIKNDSAQENYLFKILSTTSNPSPLLKPLKDAGYFDPSKNPQPREDENYSIHLWNILHYLENVAKKNQSDLSDEITNILLEIINSIIEYKTETGERIENYNTDWLITKTIFLLPINSIKDKHVEFLRTSLHSKSEDSMISSEIRESIIPRLLELKAKKLLILLLEIVFEYKIQENNITEKFVPLINEYEFKAILRNHKDSIFNLCGKKATGIVIKNIKKIIREDHSKFNNSRIPTIEDHSQTNFPDRYECQLICFIRDYYQISNPKDIFKKIKWLINQDHPIFKRLAIYTINYHYDKLSSIFWSLNGNPLEIPDAKHELYELIKKNRHSFTSEQIDQIVKWIENIEYLAPDEYIEDKTIVERRGAYVKKEWLSALLGISNEAVISLYDKYNSIYPEELEHPGFDFWSELRSNSESPVEDIDLLSMPTEEVVEYLNNFQEKDYWKASSIEGLYGTLRRCVFKNPDHFSIDISTYLKLNRPYQHALLRGFYEVWRSKRAIDWKAVFLFINSILISEDFWNDDYTEKGYNYRNWIISQIADLINDGTKNDQHAFDIALLPEAEKILLLLVQKAESKNHNMRNIVSSVQISNKGKIFVAMINYSLRNARMNRKEEEYKWVESIKNEFTKRLDKSIEPSFDFSVVVGENLEILYYLDKEWVKSNLDKIFPLDMIEYWEASFTGYLFYKYFVNFHLYNLLSENGHYQKAISFDFKEDHVSDRIALHICVAYLEGWEKLENKDSLINSLLNSKNKNYFSAVIDYLWMQNENIPEKIKNQIIPLWNQIFEKLYEEKDNPDYFDLISDSSKLLSLVDSIDNDIFKWLKLAAEHIKDNRNSPLFIENLLKYVDKKPIEVAELFLIVLNSGFFPNYKEEQIKEIISKLIQTNARDNAIKICNLYLRKGFEFTRPILEEFKK